MLTNVWTAEDVRTKEAVYTLNITKSSRALMFSDILWVLFVEMLNASVKCIATCVSIFIQ